MSYLKLAKQVRRDQPEPKKPTNVPTKVTDINTARPVQRDPDEHRLLASGWSPKDRCGPLNLTIWADPETGFYCSQEIALYRVDRGAGGEA